MGKEMTTCPHCGEVVKKGNFCNKCGKKLAKICDCWLMKRPYNCNFQQCPDMAAFTLLLLHIQQDQKLTVLMNSHNLELSQEFSSRLIGLNQGTVVLDAPADTPAEDILAAVYHRQEDQP